MASATLRTAARAAAHLAAPAALCALAASQRSRCNAHDDTHAHLKAEIALLRGENTRLRRSLTGEDLGLDALRGSIADFAKERDWDQFHTPRNILLALVGEVGEAAECFQWKGEVERGLPKFTEAEKTHVGEELADVLIYTVRLADVCGISLVGCVPRKIEMNARKYPADQARARSEKYTAYVSKP